MSRQKRYAAHIVDVWRTIAALSGGSPPHARAVRLASVLGSPLNLTGPGDLRECEPHRQDKRGADSRRTVRILVESPRPGDALVVLDQAALLKEILPEITDMKGVNQPKEFHPEATCVAIRRQLI